MPSGDCAAAAVFCLLIAMEFKMPMVYILLPLVMLGRVYYQCHWLTDTLVGVLVGSFFGMIAVSNFNMLVPFFKELAGTTAFVPAIHDASDGVNTLAS